MAIRHDPEEIDRCLPLRPAEFQVLLSLSGGEKHGYAILKEVRGRTEGKLRFNISTLYGIIHRLEERGILAEALERPDPALDDERRRYYRLTGFGRQVAQAEAHRLQELLATAQARHLLSDPQTS